MHKSTVQLAAACLLVSATPGLAQASGGDAKESLARMTPDVRANTLALEKSLHPSGGTIQIPGGHATLNLGKDYYFVSADEAKRVLTEAWGNSPQSISGVLGMVFPAGRTFYDGAWGAVIQYEDSGHIDDKNATSEDYEAVLTSMRDGEEEQNKAAKEGGYSASHLVGWAQPPSYDAAGKTLIWARDIKFEGSPQDTLNYDVRKLGRTGVLSLNMVDGMSNLPAIRTAAVDLGRTVQFEGGSGYADFNKSTDKMADYGLAGLVAAGAGVLIAKKLGLIGIALLFLKKGIVIALALAAGGWRWIKRKLGMGGEETVEQEAAYEPALADEPVAESETPPVSVG
jgi:uncharacterized membrane-anchored protein